MGWAFSSGSEKVLLDLEVLEGQGSPLEPNENKRGGDMEGEKAQGR